MNDKHDSTTPVDSDAAQIFPLSPRERKQRRVAARVEGAIASVQSNPDAPCQREPSAIEMTDGSNAARFASTYQDRLRWVPQWRSFIHWDGRHWKRDTTDHVVQLYRHCLRSRWVKDAALCKDLETRHEWLTHLLRSDSGPRIAQVLRLARAYCSLHARELDRHHHLLTVRNGVVDLRSGELLPHDPGLFMTRLVDVDYRPDAEAPRWAEYLERFLPDLELRGFIQRTIGYSCTGHNREQYMWMHVGEGSNGKSTLFIIISSLLGELAGVAPKEALIVPKRGMGEQARYLVPFAEKRLITCSETDCEDRLNEPLIKQLTGGDSVAARRQYQEQEDFVNRAKVHMLTNHRPVVHGADHGIWRRLLIVPWTVTIPDDQADKSFPERVLREEAEGVLAWCVAGAVACHASGLRPPECVRVAVAEHRAEQDRLAPWLEERAELGSEFSVGAGEAFKAYHQWANDEEIPKGDRVTKQAFPGAMTQRPGIVQTPKGAGGKRYLGLRLKPLFPKVVTGQ